MENHFQYMTDIALRFTAGSMNSSLRVYPVYLLSFLAIAFFIYAFRIRKTGGPRSFFSWAFPKQVYFHPSHITDLKLFVVGRLLAGLSVFSGIATPTYMAVVTVFLLSSLTGSELGSRTEPLGPGGVILFTLVITLISDFCVYWVHRIHHLNGILWPFHSVHHSAEILAPVTTYRKHPVYDLIANLSGDLFRGAAQGIVLLFFTGKIDLWVLGGTNAFYVLFNITVANFRHSHIWIGFGPVVEHVFISPAQHQIHHSRAPRHHNKNFGEIFALWDWMFGTLYVPQGEEKLEFGLARADGTAMPQPHGTLKDALIQPFKDSAQVYRRQRRKKAKAGAQGQRRSTE